MEALYLVYLVLAYLDLVYMDQDDHEVEEVEVAYLDDMDVCAHDVDSYDDYVEEVVVDIN